MRIDRRRSHVAAGARCGRWTVIRDREPSGRVYVRCDCGTERDLAIAVWNRQISKSCGCWKIEQARVNSTTHGASRTPTHVSWRKMWVRCTNPNNNRFQYYGGRGITVCEAWRDFAVFLADVGPRPPGKTLDRIDTEGNYEPGNCRWATAVEQRNNRRETLRSHCKNRHEYPPGSGRCPQCRKDSQARHRRRRIS